MMQIRSIAKRMQSKAKQSKAIRLPNSENMYCQRHRLPLAASEHQKEEQMNGRSQIRPPAAPPRPHLPYREQGA